VWHAQRSASVAPVPLSQSPASARLTFAVVSGCSFIAATLVRFIACGCVGVRSAPWRSGVAWLSWFLK
jgi:hypothetical protein